MRNKIIAFTCCLLIAGCSSPEKKEVAAKPAVMPPPQVTRAWLDEYEPRVRDALKDSHFEFERRENVLLVTAPVQGSFNPDRPQMLLPVSLGPITRVAKLLEADEDIAVLVLGHADSSGDRTLNRDLSQQRARAVTSIFRLSGLKQNRLQVMGLGSDAPRAANDSAAGRTLNRRVEILLTSRETMQGLVARYSQPPKAELADAPKVAVVDQGKKGKSE